MKNTQQQKTTQRYILQNIYLYEYRRHPTTTDPIPRPQMQFL